MHDGSETPLFEEHKKKTRHQQKSRAHQVSPITKISQASLKSTPSGSQIFVLWSSDHSARLVVSHVSCICSYHPDHCIAQPCASFLFFCTICHDTFSFGTISSLCLQSPSVHESAPQTQWTHIPVFSIAEWLRIWLLPFAHHPHQLLPQLAHLLFFSSIANCCSLCGARLRGYTSKSQSFPAHSSISSQIFIHISASFCLHPSSPRHKPSMMPMLSV